MSEIIMLFCLILLNSFFAMTEIAFVSLNDAKMDLLAESGDKKAQKIKKLLDVPSKFLATIQIGVTLAGFLSSAFAAESFADDLAPLLTPLLGSSAKNIAIILVTMIAFGGIYVQYQNRMENKIEGYSYAMDLKGTRNIRLKIDIRAT